MPDVFTFIAALDGRRSQRARELSELKTRMVGAAPDPYDLNSKSVIVLSYANWEGFYNDCISIYLEYLKHTGIKTVKPHWAMLVGALDADFARLRDKNHSYDAKTDFVEVLQSKITSTFDEFDAKCLLARSNLDFEKVRSNFRIMGLDISSILKFRNRMDKELIAWRHSVAHGNSPVLEDFAIEKHIDFTSNLLLALAGVFQEKMISVEDAL